MPTSHGSLGELLVSIRVARTQMVFGGFGIITHTIEVAIKIMQNSYSRAELIGQLK